MVRESKIRQNKQPQKQKQNSVEDMKTNICMAGNKSISIEDRRKVQN